MITLKKMTQKQFADHLGVQPSYVTKLKQTDRLVMDGKKVLVVESIARIEETKDPKRDDVSDRHRKNRSGEALKPSDPQSSQSLNKSRAEKEFFNARTAEIEFRKKAGETCEISRVHHAAGEAGAIVRSALENWPDHYAPMFAAESDKTRVHALMVESVEKILHEIADQTSKALTNLQKVQE